jgi:hypothetical protein
MTAKINELEIKTEEEADQIRQFAIENEAYLNSSLSRLEFFLQLGDVEGLVVNYSKILAETYVSGLKAGMEVANNVEQEP